MLSGLWQSTQETGCACPAWCASACCVAGAVAVFAAGEPPAGVPLKLPSGVFNSSACAWAYVIADMISNPFITAGH